MYLFYLDESGEREYTSSSRYFVLCGLGVPVSQWRKLNQQVLSLKQTYFTDVDVEIKSSWLLHPKERNKHYLSKYPISEDDIGRFTEEIYRVLQTFDVVIIATVVDKHQLKTLNADSLAPTTIAYQTLFEQIELFLKPQDEIYGVLIFDKINENEFRRKGYENLLAKQHLNYLHQGTGSVQVSRIVEGLLFIPSHENNLLQLADLCAYNIYRQFADHGDEWGSGFKSKYPYFERIESKIYCDPSGNYCG